MSERLARGLARADEAMCARVDAEAARMAAAGEAVDPAEFRDDGPDPLGIDYAWASAALAPGHVQPGVAPAARATPPSARKTALYAGGVVVAASLMFAAGALLPRGDGREVAMAARISVAGDRERGPNAPPVVLVVENRAARPGFITVAGLRSARSPIYHEHGSAFLEVGPGQVRRIALPPEFAGETDAVVVLTATPAREAVAKALDAGGVPADPSAARDRLVAALKSFGYTDAACELVRLGRPGR